MSSQIIEKDGKLFIRTKDTSKIKLLIDEVVKRGWNTVKVSGDEKLKAAFISESLTKGIKIVEENIAQSIKLPASKVALEYKQEIIPNLKQEITRLTKIRKQKGINTTEYDRVYNISKLSGVKKEIDDKFFNLKHILNKAVIDYKYYDSLGELKVDVRRAIDSRYTLAEPFKVYQETRGIKKNLRS